jgi:hypothetical protein
MDVLTATLLESFSLSVDVSEMIGMRRVPDNLESAGQK